MDPVKYQRLVEVDRLLLQAPDNVELDDARRALFEEFLEAFPTAPKHWYKYLSEELRTKDLVRVQKLLYRCLPNVPDVDIFEFYMNFIIYTQSIPIIDKIRAFDYALDHVGLDYRSYKIYVLYLDFLLELGKDPEILKEYPTFLLDKPREVFHRALDVPMDEIKDIMVKYYNFENERARSVAKNLITEWKAHEKVSQDIANEKQKIFSRLSIKLFETGKEEFELTMLWKVYIKFEQSNSLITKPERRHQFVVYAYRCALMTLRYSWIMWHEYAQYLLSYGDDDKALAVYAEAVQVLPHNPMISFAYAELLESRRRIPEAEPVYRRFIDNAQTPSDATLGTINLLKFLQRTAGPDAMRREFVGALTRRDLTYHVVIAAAAIENQVNHNTRAAATILVRGLDKHGSDEGYVHEFVRQLAHLHANDELKEAYRAIRDRAPGKRVLPVARQLLEYFRFEIGERDFLEEVEEDILRFDPNETSEHLALMSYFLPAKFT